MQTALPGGSAAPGSPPAAGAALLAVAALVVAGALFLGHGSSDGPLLWLGGGALVAASAALAAALLGRLPWPAPTRLGGLSLLLFAALVVWIGASIWWSIEPDASWNALNRYLAYLAFACLGLFVGACLPGAPRAFARTLAALLGLLLAWSLLSKVAPTLYEDGGRIARLRFPVGYWNALALLGDLALALALWVAVESRRPVGRAAGVLLLYAAIVATALTYSRAGLGIGILAVGLWLALGRARLESLAALFLAGLPALAVSAFALTRSGLADDDQNLAVRTHDGRLFGFALVAGALAVWYAAFFVARWAEGPVVSERRARLLVRWTLLALGAVAAAAIAVVLVRAGGPGPWLDGRVDELTRSPREVSQESSRLTSLNSSHRWTWWGIAWHQFEQHRLEGTGAQTFDLSHRLFRRTATPFATEPHSFPLQLLTELGVVGFVLGTGALAAALAALARVREPASVALSIGVAAYVLHALIDIDLDYVAVSAPAFLALGVLLGAERPARLGAERSWLWAAGALGLALAALSSLASPWLASRRLDQATAAIGEARLARAAELASDAHTLNPLAVDPLFVQAGAESARGNDREAERLLRKALATQPLNARTWYELGTFELETLRRPAPAYFHLNRSYTLDQFGGAGVKGGPLDRAKKLVGKTS